MTLDQTRLALVERRKQKKIKQKTFAADLGMAYIAVNAYEKGRGQYTFKVAQRFARQLGLEISIKLIDPETGEVIE